MEEWEDLGMSWHEVIEALVDATSAALVVGDWAEVMSLTADL